MQLRTRRAGGGRPDPDTVVSPGVVRRRTVRRPARHVMRLTGCSPARIGRHCASCDRPGIMRSPHLRMGFCLFNNVAIAARVATDKHELDRVLVVDWDVHHGNATQDTFYADGRVGFFSIHRWPFYPGTGASDETGTGAGLGATLEFARRIRHACARRTAITFRRELEDFAARIKPQLVLVQRRLRQPPRGSDRLAGPGGRRLCRADASTCSTWRMSTPAAASSACSKAATTRSDWPRAWPHIFRDCWMLESPERRPLYSSPNTRCFLRGESAG